MKKKITPRAFGIWKVWENGDIQNMAYQWYFIPGNRLSERLECHVHRKGDREMYRPDQFDTAIAYARRSLGVPYPEAKCYCGDHVLESQSLRAQSVATAVPPKPKRPVSAGLRYEILKRDNYRCQYCGATPEHAYLHVDHRISLKDGGSNLKENLVTACADCNLGKGSQSVYPGGAASVYGRPS